MKEEIWKDIKGYEGLYQVSNLGNVRNVKRNTIIKKNTVRGKFVSVVLCKDGSKISYMLKNVVYNTFIGDIKGRLKYKDGDFMNNELDNLINEDTFKSIIMSIDFGDYYTFKNVSKKDIDNIRTVCAQLKTDTDINYTSSKRGNNIIVRKKQQIQVQKKLLKDMNANEVEYYDLRNYDVLRTYSKECGISVSKVVKVTKL